RDLARALTINFLTAFRDLPVNLNAPCFRQTFVQNVLIQRVNEAISRRYFAVRQLVSAAILNVLPLTRELRTTFFHDERIFFESGGQRETGKLDTRHARCFECPLLITAEKFDLAF